MYVAIQTWPLRWFVNVTAITFRATRSAEGDRHAAPIFRGFSIWVVWCGGCESVSMYWAGGTLVFY